ncbi:MAG: hypothetical protein JW722_02780 [Demequinaceae bacterium]|nr:hypothetical protein [Demequinaceae bacterium]
MALRDGTAAALSAVVVAGIAVSLGLGMHAILPAVETSPSASPTSPSGTTTNEFCDLMGNLHTALGQMDQAMQASILILDGGETVDPEVLDALHASGQAIIDYTEIVSGYLLDAVDLVVDQEARTAFAAYARVNDELGEVFGNLAIEAESIADYGIAFQEVATDPEFTAVISEADAVEPIVLEYVFQTCGIDLSASSDSGTIGDVLKADVSTLGTAMAAYYVDWTPGSPQPVITVADGQYYRNGVLVGAQSTGVALTDQYALGPADWCVQVTADGNPGEVYSYSAMHGLRSETCAALQP